MNLKNEDARAVRSVEPLKAANQKPTETHIVTELPQILFVDVGRQLRPSEATGSVIMKTTQFGHRSRHSFGTAARFGAVLASATFLLFNAPAWAQEPTAAETAAARDLAIEGMKLADSERCGQAIDKLDRAEKLRHSPIVLGRLGECRIQVGKFVDGIEDLQRLLHESPPPNPPAMLLRARERAQAALDAAKPNLAYLAISVSGPTENVTVTIDGQPVSSLLLDR